MSKQRFFTSIIQKICNEESIHIEKYAQGWCLGLTKNSSTHYVWGYRFDLNGSAEYMIAVDKYLTYEFCKRNNIRIPDSSFLMHREKCEDVGIKYSNIPVKEYDVPVIVKDNTGTCGNDVYLCSSEEEIQDKIEYIHSLKKDVIISKFIPHAREFRFIVLDKEIHISYEKVKKDNNLFKHNLSGGNSDVSEIIPDHIDKTIDEIISKIPLRLYSVDILVNEQGSVYLLEINSGVMMEAYINSVPDGEDKVYHFYKEIIKRIFD